MSHTRGLKRKNAFLQSGEHKSTAVQRVMQEIEAERQRKERLEWYLNEVMKEKEALSRFDDSMPAVSAFLANSSPSSSSTSTTATTSSSSSSSASALSSTSSTSPSGHNLTADYNRWTNTQVPHAEDKAPTTEVPVPVIAVEAVEVPAELESCERCGRQYVESQKTCRCRNFESVKKRQRCLSRFVRTGHMLEVVDTTTTSVGSTSSFDLQGFNFVDAAFHNTTATTASSGTGEDSFATVVSDEDFLRMILDEAGMADTTSSTTNNSLKVEPVLGEKNQRRRRASFVGTKDGWDMSSVGEEGYFLPAAGNTAVFGY
jgi:hypothetical protein